MQRDRPITFGALLPFPTVVIDYWGERLALGPMAFAEFEKAIKALDTAWLADVRKPTTK